MKQKQWHQGVDKKHQRRPQGENIQGHVIQYIHDFCVEIIQMELDNEATNDITNCHRLFKK